MRKRTKARQVALQFLYQMDLRNDEILEQKDTFIESTECCAEVRKYALELIDGCRIYWENINDAIAKVAKNWDLSRMAVVDRTILRIAVYELLYRKDVPQKVVINEAINLGKRFSTEHSGAFINGILDNLKKN
ncbi:transcription antitermination factor NusB [Candidatus Uabimicrobium amorphum]|uniref:Transcription antitermination protein NusB n=1 Tax=Uabimicrobium amorphum TaxID=2596890 RepID=A0A5S9IRK6_UABAM|nr:transcription antitermination factor NusB [Candidatus Uabimicrobium amorphum]BBM86427.1 N utilization substance protein B homolog [Candidatus Uabimicrobium amorphum]